MQTFVTYWNLIMPPNFWAYPGYIAYQQILDTRTWWTAELVSKFMPEEDLAVPNPHNASQTMRLYSLDRVRRVEQGMEFLTAVCGKPDTKHQFKAIRSIFNRYHEELRHIATDRKLSRCQRRRLRTKSNEIRERRMQELKT